MTPRVASIALHLRLSAATRTSWLLLRPLSTQPKSQSTQLLDSQSRKRLINLPLEMSNNDQNTRTAEETDQYLTSKLITSPKWGADPALARGLQREREASMPNISVSALQGQFLTILAKSIKASRILEIGTLGGYSTAFLSKALPSHGQLDTLEISPHHAQIAQQNFLDADLFPFPKIHIGPALETLQNPSGPFANPPGYEEGFPEDERGYDLIFIDADKERVLDYFLESLRLAKKGGVVVVDNAVRGGRIAYKENDEPKIDVVGMRKFYDWIEKDDGKTVLASGIQTVGQKGWDGFAIVHKL